MFYKNDNGEWYKVNEIHFPDNIKLTSYNKIERDGWKWYDEDPIEYLEYLENKDNIE